MNKSWAWINWQKANYSGDLHHYIEETRKFLLELDSILSRLKEYASHCQAKDARSNTLAPASALVSSTSNEPYQIIYYCSNGRHNSKFLTHKKEECFAENHHLRLQRQNNKRKKPNSSSEAHISVAQALYTNADQRLSPGQLVYCGANHHMFHSESAFTSLSKDIKLAVTTGDSSSNLIAEGMGTVNLLSNNQILKLTNYLFVPKLNCNLVSLLKIFDKELIIN
ncbi:hypothetical protein O181_039869 [Austropuccinia psidii MF-1]|uniref:Retrovirus-related Pol polyprotein from transposon TNT 1-94-like beta-barrel domain-containing protein n=1 Tax=Austropuccinia psidii MF-1 TaxID=1389203 RepID=A0A9Q3HEY6_9BASI|nr:hypothetical protein [Austropuccinia psidii MF-1]